VRPVREIRTLGAMWRGLETDSRFGFQGTFRPLRQFVSLTNVQRSISAPTVNCKGQNYPLPLTAAVASGVPLFQCVSAR
jgi:hypothetical protein